MKDNSTNNKTTTSVSIDNQSMIMAKCIREFAAFLQAREVIVVDTAPVAKCKAVFNTDLLTPVGAIPVRAE